ncbi:hypothetical protein SprV_0602118000 [Sparganum proliferum]
MISYEMETDLDFEIKRTSVSTTWAYFLSNMVTAPVLSMSFVYTWGLSAVVGTLGLLFLLWIRRRSRKSPNTHLSDSSNASIFFPKFRSAEPKPAKKKPLPQMKVRPVRYDMELKRYVEANRGNVDPEFLSHLPSRVKKMRHEEELAALSEAERQDEMKVRERQLAEISALMLQRPDQFAKPSWMCTYWPPTPALPSLLDVICKVRLTLPPRPHAPSVLPLPVVAQHLCFVKSFTLIIHVRTLMRT